MVKVFPHPHSAVGETLFFAVAQEETTLKYYHLFKAFQGVCNPSAGFAPKFGGWVGTQRIEDVRLPHVRAIACGGAPGLAPSRVCVLAFEIPARLAQLPPGGGAD